MNIGCTYLAAASPLPPFDTWVAESSRIRPTVEDHLSLLSKPVWAVLSQG